MADAAMEVDAAVSNLACDLEVELQKIFLQLARAYLRGSVECSQLATFYQDVHRKVTGTGQSTSEDASLLVGPSRRDDPLLVPSVLVDVIWLLDIESVDDSDGDSAAAKAAKGRNLKELVKQIMARNFVPLVLLKERLEIEFLELVGAIPSHKLFNKKSIRLNTSLLYKQQKFNLLREESEGFSMLETYLASNLPKPFDSYWQSYKNTRSVREIADLRKANIKERVAHVLENITSLIGYFDLNPNKVLDVVLDIFIANVTDHWDFFIELLEASCWCGRSVSRRLGNEEAKDLKGERSVCGQVLGFKFDYYNSVAPPTQNTPPQLFWIAALLIRHQLVRLEDLYSHLSPNDDQIDSEFDAYITTLKAQSKREGRYNDTKLADAGALGMDDFPPKDRPAADLPAVVAAPILSLEPRQGKRSNQKAMLAAHLIAIGDLSHGRMILDRLPKLCNMYPEIAENMCRLMHVIVEPVYKTIRPTSLFVTKPMAQRDSVAVNTLNPKLSQIFEKTLVGKKAYPAKYKFFYDPWKEGLPVYTDIDSLLKAIRALLPYVGAHLSKDSVLLSKISRIGRAHISNPNADDRIKNSWISIVAQYLFPALALTHHNPGLANEVWGLVKQLPYDRRFALYGEWKHKTYEAIPELVLAKERTNKDAKYIMKRLSKETTKQYGRHIGKIVHSNPAVAFKVILNLLQVYDNQITFFVDASRYLTELSFDLKLLQHEKIGCKIEAQLAKNNVQDLVVLQDLIGQMSGVKPVEEATDHQLEALAGGETLRREVFLFETARFTRKASIRLTRALIECNLAAPLAILIGQQRKDCIYRGEEREIKSLGWLQDNVQRTLLLYCEFLASAVERELIIESIPDITDLRITYGLEPEKDEDAVENNQSNEASGATKAKTHPLPSLRHIGDVVSKTLPEKVWAVVPPQFYVTFWQLALSDIMVPKSRYASEILKQRSLIESLDNDRSDMQPSAVAKRKKDRDRSHLMIQQLDKEMKTQEENSKRVDERLKLEKDSWFCPATELEAKNYGLFLADILGTLASWHQDKHLYVKEGRGDGLPGFALRWNSANPLKTPDADLLEYDGFCKAIYKWHSKIHKAFLNCVESKEYVQIRNAIFVLDKFTESNWNPHSQL
ncbi:THO complex subunit 2 [Irineochytrium annulatum]|nr:THO complex subunit 2 [Irineochytrium annulatum]